ncbi:uncharacterized protein LOC106012001 [Aplysia californica]|uniref:Uncharacterized protein LOC106012001 n=1 Tax=Aplysia californica TaxID=6500 RepID=A0ABM1A1K2_APLCA|nr:uncharacterized protein LOC106012001 [Aplysia californica]
MFHRNIDRREFGQFPSLTETPREGRVSDEELKIYTNHLRDLHADMIAEARFTDIFKLEIPDWVLDPFNTGTDGDLTVAIEEELTVKRDFEIEPLFKKSYQSFRLKTIVQDKYPSL